MQCDLFKLLGDVEERILDVQGGKQGRGAFLEDLGPGVEVLVDPVPKAHQPEFLAFDLFDAFLDRDIPVADVFERMHHGGVCPSVQPAPQGADSGRDRGKKIGFARSDHPHRGTGAILLVIGMHHQKLRQGFLRFGCWHVLLVGHGKHHVQKVFAVRTAGVRVDDGQPRGLAITESRDGAHFADKLGHGLAKLRFGLDVQQIGVVGSERIDDRRENGHGMPVGRKTFEMMHEILMQQGRIAEHGPKRGPLLAGRQFTEDEQHDRLHEGTLPRQLFNGIPAIAQDSLFPVHKRYGAVT